MVEGSFGPYIIIHCFKTLYYHPIPFCPNIKFFQLGMTILVKTEFSSYFSAQGKLELPTVGNKTLLFNVFVFRCVNSSLVCMLLFPS